MDAPTYPPAATFEQPIAAPFMLRLENVSLSELMARPVAWDIVVKHLPSINLMTRSPMMKPQLGNFTLLSLQTFAKTASPEVLAAIDAELALLPRVQEPTT